MPILAALAGLTLTACGSSGPAADTTPDGTQPTATRAPTASGAPVDPARPDTEATADAEDVPASSLPGGPPATDSPATEAEPAAPEPVPLGGRTFATDVRPASQFDANPFPDLVVNDVGRGGEANIANIVPSDRPVLLWTWAPH